MARSTKTIPNLERDDPMGPDPQFVTALARGLDILRCFTIDRPALGTTEIAHLTGLAQPTVWRICYTLRQLDYLTAVFGGTKLQLGPMALILEQTAATTLPVADVGRSRMQDIADSYRASIGLAVRDRLEMVLVQRCQGAAPLVLNHRVGSRVGLASITYGWAYMAALQAEPRERLLAQLRKSDSGEWTRLQPRIADAVTNFPTLGYVINCGGFHEEINSIAVPVLGPGGAPAYSFSLGGLGTMLTRTVLEQHVAPLLLALSAFITSALPQS